MVDKGARGRYSKRECNGAVRPEAADQIRADSEPVGVLPEGGLRHPGPNAPGGVGQGLAQYRQRPPLLPRRVTLLQGEFAEGCAINM